MTTTVEAWSVPGSGPFVKKDFAVEFDHLQVGLSDSEPTSGIIQVSKSGKDRIIDSANNETSLIRVFKDGHNCQSFVAQTVRYPYGHTGPVQISGMSIHGELEYGAILPQHYPENNDPDYEYRALDVLVNPDAEGEASWVGDDFEEGPPAGDPWTNIHAGEDWNDPHSKGVTSAWARNGTYSLRFNPAGSNYSGIKRTVACRPATSVTVVGYINSPEADDVGVQLMLGATVEEGGGKQGPVEQYYIEEGLLVAEIGNAPKGTGVTADTTTWYQTTLRFITGPKQTSFDLMFIKGPDGIATADDVLLDDVTLEGTGLGTEPWRTWSGVTMLRQSSVVDEGDFAFQFQVYDYTTTEYLQGIIQDIRTGANQGRRFTFQTKVRKTDAGDRRVVALIKRGSGTWLASKSVIVNPAAGWVDIEVSATIDEDRFTVEVRDAETHDPGGSNGPVIYVGKSKAFWGLGEQPAGKIIRDQIQAVKDRGSLTWLKTDSFDENTDSNGVPWPDKEEMIVWHGMTILQLLDTFKQKGFGWDVIWNEGAGQYELQVFVPFSMGGDLTSSGLKFHGVNLREAEINEQDPGANSFYAEGELGVYAEGANALLQAGYGRRERWLNTESSLTEADLQRRIAKASVAAQADRFALVADVGPWFTPGQSARVGSLVKVEMSGEVAERQERIARMSFTVTGSEESTRLIFGGDTSFYSTEFTALPIGDWMRGPGRNSSARTWSND